MNRATWKIKLGADAKAAQTVLPLLVEAIADGRQPVVVTLPALMNDFPVA